MRYLKTLMMAAMLALLAACGGGGGSAGTTGGSGSGSGSGSGGSTTGPTVASYVYTLDKTTLSNSGSDSVLLTITALDANNNPVNGVTVTVAPDSGIYTPIASTTDANGQASGRITIGASKTDREINTTITVNGVAKVFTVPVVGSQISITPVPATPVPGQSVTLNIKASDAIGTGIPNLQITLSGTAGFSGIVTTDATGNATTSANVPGTNGTYNVIAAGSGVSITKAIIVASGGGAIPNAVGVVSSASISPDSSTISTNASGTANRARLTAKFTTASSAGIANMRVRFEIMAPALGSGEFISTGDSVVYTDASGQAQADYVAGTRSSATNGVLIRACYSASDFAVGTCPNSVQTTLTVNGQPLDISIGDNNTMQKGLGGISYIKQFLVQVADSAGNAVPDAVISASVDITHFGKGFWGSSTATYQVTGLVPPKAADTYATTFSNTFNVTPTAMTGRVWCVNEDSNRNGSFDSGEDFDGNGRLEPKKSEIVLSFVSGNKTDSNGQLLLQIFYPQNMGTWLAYTIKASTTVTGSEGVRERSFITNVLEDDVSNGSFLTPPFGTSACNAP